MPRKGVEEIQENLLHLSLLISKQRGQSREAELNYTFISFPLIVQNTEQMGKSTFL